MIALLPVAWTAVRSFQLISASEDVVPDPSDSVGAAVGRVYMLPPIAFTLEYPP